MDTDTYLFFTKMPEAMPLYEAVKDVIIGSMENVEVKIHKTQISFYHNKGFAYVWLPIRKIKNRPEVYIVLTFGLAYQLKSPRILESVKPYPNRWTHHVIIENISDIDDEIIDWLHQAYLFAQR